MANSKKKPTKAPKPTAKQLERMALQKQREKEYKKQRNRIKRFMRQAEARGYVFNASAKALLKEPKRITQSSIEKLSRFTPNELYKKSSIELEGKKYRGLEGRKKERSIVAQKSAQTRKKNAPFMKKSKDLLKGYTNKIKPITKIEEYTNPFENGELKSATALSVASKRLKEDREEFNRMASIATNNVKTVYSQLIDLLDRMEVKYGEAFVAKWYASLNLPRPTDALYYRIYAPFVMGEIEKYLAIEGISPKDIAETYRAYDELNTEGYEFEDEPDDYNLY